MLIVVTMLLTDSSRTFGAVSWISAKMIAQADSREVLRCDVTSELCAVQSRGLPPVLAGSVSGDQSSLGKVTFPNLVVIHRMTPQQRVLQHR